MADSAVLVENLVKTFRNAGKKPAVKRGLLCKLKQKGAQKRVLDGINLNIRHGEIFGMLGLVTVFFKMDLSQAKNPAAFTVPAVASFSFIGLGTIVAVLPLLSP